MDVRVKINKDMIDFKTYVKLSKLFADELTKDTLGFSRRSLPQISDIHDFKRFLNTQKVNYVDKEVVANKLTATQKHLNHEKIAKLLSLDSDKTKQIIISKDNYVLDGHHRWAVAVIRNEDIKAVVVNLPIEKLLDLVCDEYDKAFYKTLH